MVYHTVQEPADAMSLEDLATMDREIASLRENIGVAKANEKLLRANLISVNATLSTEEVCHSVSILEHETEEILRRLGPLRLGNVKPVLPQEKATVDGERSRWMMKAGIRKKICMELWEMCTEELPEGKTKVELWASTVLMRTLVGSLISGCTQEEWGLEGEED